MCVYRLPLFCADCRWGKTHLTNLLFATNQIIRYSCHIAAVVGVTFIKRPVACFFFVPNLILLVVRFYRQMSTRVNSWYNYTREIISIEMYRQMSSTVAVLEMLCYDNFRNGFSCALVELYAVVFKRTLFPFNYKCLETSKMV